MIPDEKNKVDGSTFAWPSVCTHDRSPLLLAEGEGSKGDVDATVGARGARSSARSGVPDAPTLHLDLCSCTCVHAQTHEWVGGNATLPAAPYLLLPLRTVWSMAICPSHLRPLVSPLLYTDGIATSARPRPSYSGWLALSQSGLAIDPTHPSVRASDCSIDRLYVCLYWEVLCSRNRVTCARLTQPGVGSVQKYETVAL